MVRIVGWVEACASPARRRGNWRPGAVFVQRVPVVAVVPLEPPPPPLAAAATAATPTAIAATVPAVTPPTAAVVAPAAPAPVAVLEAAPASVAGALPDCGVVWDIAGEEAKAAKAAIRAIFFMVTPVLESAAG